MTYCEPAFIPDSTSPSFAEPTLLEFSNLRDGRYKYAEDLLTLEQASAPVPFVPFEQRVVSPLKLTAWKQYLQSHPDPRLKEFILRGLEHGFRIGVKESSRLRRAPRNLASAVKQPQVVQSYLDRELSLGKILFVPPQASSPPLIQISSFGVIPKKHKPNKWQLIN